MIQKREPRNRITHTHIYIYIVIDFDERAYNGAKIVFSPNGFGTYTCRRKMNLDTDLINAFHKITKINQRPNKTQNYKTPRR